VDEQATQNSYARGTKSGDAIRTFWDSKELSILKEVYLKQRLKSLQKKIERMQKMHIALATVRGNTSHQWTSTGAIVYLHRLGVPIPISVLEPPTQTHHGPTLHPLLDIVYNEMLHLMDVSDKIEFASENVLSLDPCEYVPDITISKYLGTRKELRSRFSSSLMMDALKVYANMPKPQPAESPAFTPVTVSVVSSQ